MSSLRLPLCAVTVTVPAVSPVRVLVATPLEAVAEPSPVTEPEPEVWLKLTLVELSPVTTLPLASWTSAVMSRVEPLLRSAVELVMTSFAGAPATTANVVVSSARLPLCAVMVTEPASSPVDGLCRDAARGGRRALARDRAGARRLA